MTNNLIADYFKSAFQKLTIMPGFIASSQDGITTIVVVLIIQQPFSRRNRRS
jgi:hypothetical protein